MGHRSGLALAIALLTPLGCPQPTTASERPAHTQHCSDVIGGRTPLQWGTFIADAEIASKGGQPRTLPGQRGRLGKGTDYANALWAIALFRLGQATGDTRYIRYADQIIADVVASGDGSHIASPAVPASIRFNEMLTGRALIEALEYDPDPRLQRAAVRFRQALNALPRTGEGVYAYHPGNIIPDGLYMTLPFQAQYGSRFGSPADHTDAVSQLRVAFQRLKDPTSGLLRHGWDGTGSEAWARRETGQSSGYWGRGMGWYLLTVVDTLDYVPFGYDAQRASLVAQLRWIAAGLPRWQDIRTGLWHNVPDQPGRTGNFLETSASAMYSYALAKGMNRGYLSDIYLQTAYRAFAGIILHRLQIDAAGAPHLLYTSNVASLGRVPGQVDPQQYRDASWEYYMSEGVSADNPHAVATFVMAAIEMDRLVQSGRCRSDRATMTPMEGNRPPRLP